MRCFLGSATKGSLPTTLRSGNEENSHFSPFALRRINFVHLLRCFVAHNVITLLTPYALNMNKIISAKAD